MFRAAGYATCIAGKWQSGSKDAALPKHFGGAEHCLWSLLGRGERYAEPSLSANGAFKTFAGKSRPDLARIFHTQLDQTDFTEDTEPRPQSAQSGQGIWLRELGSKLGALCEKEFIQESVIDAG